MWREKMPILLRNGWLAGTFLVLAAAGAAHATGPTFDCKKVTHEIEKTICGDNELSALDRKLDATFRDAMKVVEKTPGKTETLKEMKTLQRGWIGGRNECWKADDKRQCALDSYRHRIAELQARYMLVKALAPVFYVCESNPADEIVATFMQSDPPGVRLERGDDTQIAIEGLTGSGARYVGNFGLVFWIKGNDAMVTWPQGHDFNCTVKKR